jgi:hypothetical protein
MIIARRFNGGVAGNNLESPQGTAEFCRYLVKAGTNYEVEREIC